jgi:hypothetical protein
MTRQSSAPIPDDHGWLITPRALTSLATAVGLVYTLHAPVRYVMRMGADVDALNARVASLETEIDHQRGTIAAAELILDRERQPAGSALDTAHRAPHAEPQPDRRRARREQ